MYTEHWTQVLAFCLDAAHGTQVLAIVEGIAYVTQVLHIKHFPHWNLCPDPFVFLSKFLNQFAKIYKRIF